MTLRERDVRSQITDWLSRYGYFWEPLHSGAARMASGNFTRFGTPGRADLLVVFGGHAVFVEIKAPDGRQSDKQKVFEQRVNAAGAVYVLARSLEDVIEQVRPLQSEAR